MGHCDGGRVVEPVADEPERLGVVLVDSPEDMAKREGFACAALIIRFKWTYRYHHTRTGTANMLHLSERAGGTADDQQPLRHRHSAVRENARPRFCKVP